MIFALLIAAFVVVPLVDAAFCALEDEIAHVSIAADGDSQPGYQVQDEGSPFTTVDGHCDHGHCHHTTSHVCATSSGTAPVGRLIYQLADYQKAVSYTPDGLIRPPKA